MEEVKSNAGQGLGIAGLILGIIAVPLAIMGCTSVLGLILGTAGIVLSAVGLSQANKSNGMRGMPVAGLVVSILGTCIALMWLLFFARVANEGGKWWAKEGAEIFNEINSEFGDEIEEAFGEIGEELDELGEELEEKLEELEYDWDEKWGEEISEDEFSEMIDTYGDLLDDYRDLVEDADAGNIQAFAEYIKIAAKASSLAEKIEDIDHRLSEKQLQKFREIREKFEKTMEEAGGN